MILKCTGAKFTAEDQAKYAKITEKLAELCTVFTQVLLLYFISLAAVQYIYVLVFSLYIHYSIYIIIALPLFYFLILTMLLESAGG